MTCQPDGSCFRAGAGGPRGTPQPGAEVSLKEGLQPARDFEMLLRVPGGASVAYKRYLLLFESMPDFQK